MAVLSDAGLIQGTRQAGLIVPQDVQGAELFGCDMDRGRAIRRSFHGDVNLSKLFRCDGDRQPPPGAAALGHGNQGRGDLARDGRGNAAIGRERPGSACRARLGRSKIASLDSKRVGINGLPPDGRGSAAILPLASA